MDVSTIVNLPDELAARLVAEADRRGTGVDETATQILDAALDHAEVATKADGSRRHLPFAAIGASGQSRGGAQSDELLGEGFGRD
jgi:plasmid stability protein